MAKFIIATGNKLTGAKGLLGYLRIDNEVKTKTSAAFLADLFPKRIASRAANFSIVEATDIEVLVEKYGPEI